MNICNIWKPSVASHLKLWSLYRKRVWRRSWWTCCANCPLSTTCPSWLIIEWRPRRFATWAPPTSRRCVCQGCSIFILFYFFKFLSWLSVILTGRHLIGPALVSAPASVYEHQYQIINLQGNETENLFISLHHLVITSALLNIKDEIVTRDRAQPGSWSSSVLDRFLLLTDRTKLYIWCCYLHKSGKIRKTGRCCFDGLYSVKVNGVLIYLRHWVADIAICRFLYSNWIMLH